MRWRSLRPLESIKFAIHLDLWYPSPPSLDIQWSENQSSSLAASESKCASIRIWLTLTNLWQLAPLHTNPHPLYLAASWRICWCGRCHGSQHKLGDFRDRRVIYGRWMLREWHHHWPFAWGNGIWSFVYARKSLHWGSRKLIKNKLIVFTLVSWPPHK